jgi:5'-methylthioadenosine phosphorylase
LDARYKRFLQRGPHASGAFLHKNIIKEALLNSPIPLRQVQSKVTVIGGVGFDLQRRELRIPTPYGDVLGGTCLLGGREILFIPRHGEGHLPPHRIDYRALLWAAKASGSERMISVNTVGTMSYHPPGSLFLPYDFVEFTKTRKNTFYEDVAVHVDLTQPYCPILREAIKKAAMSGGIEVHEGVYVCAEGPHLESPAQIRMMRQFGDVVGMTGYPEVALAREQALCYASLCLITNPACGMRPEPLAASEIAEIMKDKRELIEEILSKTLDVVPEERLCPCPCALKEARMGSHDPDEDASLS